MFFHAKHHLFPAVPTCHLAELAARLDAAAPELRWPHVMVDDANTPAPLAAQEHAGMSVGRQFG